jgi:hypothetical protein
MAEPHGTLPRDASAPVLRLGILWDSYLGLVGPLGIPGLQPTADAQTQSLTTSHFERMPTARM